MKIEIDLDNFEKKEQVEKISFNVSISLLKEVRSIIKERGLKSLSNVIVSLLKALIEADKQDRRRN